MASRPISIKVSTAKVLSALEKALAERKKKLSDWQKAKEAYDKSLNDFHTALAVAFRDGKGKVVRVSKAWNRHDTPDNKWELTIEFPANTKAPVEPEKDFQDWAINSEIEELENTIAILKLTDEETVSANTYKGVARFIK